MKKTALITGASTGIGLSTATHLALAGFEVVATMRDLSKAQPLKDRAAALGVSIDLRQLDVQDDASIQACVGGALKSHGRIDVLVNNAGSGLRAGLEQTTDEELNRVMDVNFFGVWRMTRAVLPSMREAGSGRIITVSSVGGLIGQPFGDAYCAAKFAVEGMMESLAPVVSRLGIQVCLIEPGPVNTEFVATVRKRAAESETPPIEAYAGMLDRYTQSSLQAFSTMGQTGDDIAAVIVRAATEGTPHLRYATSELMQGIISRKYVDPTGDSVVAMTASRIQ